MQEKERARLHEIIEKVNTLFEGELSEQDKLVYVNNVLLGKLLESTTLAQHAANNTKEQFASSPDLRQEITNAIIEARDAHTLMSKQALSSEAIRDGIKDILLNHAQLVLRLKPPGPREPGPCRAPHGRAAWAGVYPMGLRGFSSRLAHCSGDPRPRPSSTPSLQPSPSTWPLSRLYAKRTVRASGFFSASKSPSPALPLQQPRGAPPLLPVTSPWDSSNPVWRNLMPQMSRRVSLRSLSLVVSVLALTLAMACGGEKEPVVGEASLGISAQALSANDISRVTVTVSGSGISPDISRNLFKTSGQWGGTLGGIPVGSDRTFKAQAYDSSNVLLYEGQVTGVTITQGSTAAVFILLQQKTAPNPFSNNAPRISALVASASQVEPGQSTTLSVTATDVDGDTLGYAWTATAGTLANATKSSSTWTAPTTEGPYTVNVSVTDGKGGQAGFSLVINVLAGRSKASVTTSFNTWPVVSQVSVTKGQVRPGESTVLDVTAVDPDGDTLAYTWNDGGCGGSFSSTTAKNPTWTAPATQPPGGTCTVSVAPRDGRGGSTTGSLTITIGLPEVPNAAPVIDQTFQSADIVAAGGTLDVLVVAHDPEGTALFFTWSASGGTLGTATTSASQSEMLWTAPASGGPFTITAVIKDAGGAQATQTFTVNLPGSP
ncbi:MAG TPA: hypothetical protein VFZ09_25280 [Archangium sp.]|uniref:Ig-like domain-containing protein n=1 Tax=Archangium sp. TaxID=1872627 RepID=UPI002E3643C7|nr:hypothetical protein [Archangium sp.]HEX5749567.1 hypothetical protein [Archangium sp.]